jgi:phosphate starvation-inducible PhoH-like protein
VTTRKHKQAEKEEQKQILPKTKKQQDLLDAFLDKDVIIAIGSAGVGKTYITVGKAADMLKRGWTKKICITRPNISMGKSSGLFPGDIFEKMMPYMLPIMDVLHERLGLGYVDCALKNKNIEVVPLETLRGRSFKDAILIVDEAQNSTPHEIKSVLTRIGENCKLILMGDASQKDIKGQSGLEYAEHIIQKYNIQEAEIIRFTHQDVVRSELCAKFVKIFEEQEKDA